jgi:hypothetical protein
MQPFPLVALVQTIHRRAELRTNLELLEPQLELVHRAAWLVNTAHDEQQRHERIAALQSPQAFSDFEKYVLEQGLQLFSRYESSNGKPKSQKHASTVGLSETIYEETTGLLLGRGQAYIRASPLQLVAYMLLYDSRSLMSDWVPEVDVRCEVVQNVNAHHTIVFNRKRANIARLRNRTFLNSIVAHKISDEPEVHLLVAFPTQAHDSITQADEAGAVRGENTRAFRMTEESAGLTWLEYVCSLDLKVST